MAIECKTRVSENDDRYTEADVPCVIVTADDGSYQVVPRAAFDADPLTHTAATKDIAAAKREALEKLAALRWERTQFFTYDGVVTPCAAAVTYVSGAHAIIVARDPPPTVEWKLAPGQWRTYDAAGLLALGSAMRDHLQACFDNERALEQQISAAATSRDVLAIDLNTGWP